MERSKAGDKIYNSISRTGILSPSIISIIIQIRSFGHGIPIIPSSNINRIWSIATSYLRRIKVGGVGE